MFPTENCHHKNASSISPIWTIFKVYSISSKYTKEKENGKTWFISIHAR